MGEEDRLVARDRLIVRVVSSLCFENDHLVDLIVAVAVVFVPISQPAVLISPDESNDTAPALTPAKPRHSIPTCHHCAGECMYVSMRLQVPHMEASIRGPLQTSATRVSV